jgi:hypothetical protein
MVARRRQPPHFEAGRERIIDFLRKLDCQLVVRSTGLLHALQPHLPRH